MDQLQTRHTQTALTHLVDFTGGLKVTTSAYYNYFWRNWYKLNDVRIGDQKGEKRSIEEILADPETNARYIDILTGATARTLRGFLQADADLDALVRDVIMPAP